MAVIESCELLYSIAKVLAVENRLPYIPKNEQKINCLLAKIFSEELVGFTWEWY
jgi:hypothetical protein